MSCHRSKSCQSPVTVTENRFFLNGEPWVLTREADLPMYIERHADSPQSPSICPDYATNQSSGDRPRQRLVFGSSSRPNSPSREMELDSVGGSQHNEQRRPELESPWSFHSQVWNTFPEPHNCVETGSCKRLHLSHPQLCKKLVQKARRALSKLGRKPGAKIVRNSSAPLPPRQHYYGFKMPIQTTSTHENRSSEVIVSELPAGDRPVHELPTERAAAESGAAENVMVHEACGKAIVHCESQPDPVGYCSEVVSPLSSFHKYYGSGSSISIWNEAQLQNSPSTRCTSITDLPDPTSHIRKLNELDSSSSDSSPCSYSAPALAASRSPPVIGANVLTTTGPILERNFGHTQLGIGINVSTKPTLWQVNSSEDLFIGDCDVCASPTSIVAPLGFSDRHTEGIQVSELDSGNYNGHEPTLSEASSSDKLPDDVVMLENTCKSISTFGSGNDLDVIPSDKCHLTVPLCPCHGLAMRPDMHLSDLIAGAKACGISSRLLIQGDFGTLGGRIESMLHLLLELALQKLDQLEPEVRDVLTPAFKVLPTFEAALGALRNLHIKETLPSMQELVSLVFMAFSIAILTVDECHLSHYAASLYIDIASWTNAFSTTSDKHIFETLLEAFWRPQACCHFTSFEQPLFCPFTVPKPQSTLEPSSSALSTHTSIRTGMAARICQYYVDLIYHAAETENIYRHHPAKKVLEKDVPPLFVESVMADIMQPHLELPVSEQMREVVSSTVQDIRSGNLTSFAQVDAHLRSGVRKRREHFGNFSNRTSRVFSTMCHNAAAMFADRKFAWLIHALQRSASRVVSQTWAEGLDIHNNSNTRKHDGGTGLTPDASITDPNDRYPSALIWDKMNSEHASLEPRSCNPTRVRETVRRRRVSQDTVPSKCSQCSRIFEGKCRRDHLRRHLKSVHGNQYLVCLLCGSRLKNRTDNFAKHLRVVHPDYIAPGNETGPLGF